MRGLSRIAMLSVAATFCCCLIGPFAQVIAQSSAIKPGSKVILRHIDGFGPDLTVALIGSNVPLTIVKDQKDAELEIGGRYVSWRESGTSDWVGEATITITSLASGVVMDAFTLRADAAQKLARACAKRIFERMAPLQTPAPRVKSEPEPAVQGLAQPHGTTRLFLQGDFERLADFSQTLRSELRAEGIPVTVVQRGEEFDFNVVFALADVSASAIALDRDGILVASVVDSGFRVKGVTEGAAKKLAKRMAALIRR